MHKISYLLLVFLVGWMACGQKKSTENQNTDLKADTVASASSVSSPFNLTITETAADSAYKRYATKVRTEGFSLCSGELKIKYLRLIRKHINDHIPQIDTTTLPEPDPRNKFAGIRIYPCINKAQQLAYLIVYTDSIPRGGHRDRRSPIYLINLNIPQRQWCALSSSHYHQEESKHILSNHRTCDPDCPAEDAPLFNF